MSQGRAAWRYACASVVGSSHARRGRPCQDASACRVVERGAGGEAVLVALVADGAGSALCAQEGAQLTCGFLLAAIDGALAAGTAVADLTRDVVAGWIAALRARLGEQAAAAGRELRAYASTLVGAVVGSQLAVFFQIGDGAIVVSAPEEGYDGYGWIFWPGGGEYENTTFFVTDAEFLNHLEWTLIERPFDEVALFSDGLQRLALHFQTRTAYAPFFRSKLAPIAAAADVPAEALSAELARFLASPVVEARTDDDKTLILATRRPAPVAAPDGQAAALPPHAPAAPSETPAAAAETQAVATETQAVAGETQTAGEAPGGDAGTGGLR